METLYVTKNFHNKISFMTAVMTVKKNYPVYDKKICTTFKGSLSGKQTLILLPQM